MSPSQAAKSRPRRKVDAGGARATSAVATKRVGAAIGEGAAVVAQLHAHLAATK